MKKAISVILCMTMFLSCVILSGCGSSQKDLSDSKYLGTWKAASLSLMDESGEFEDEILLILNADGTAQMTSGDEVTESTWEETKDGLKLKGGAKMTFTEEGDGIKSSLLGVELHFVRQETVR